MPTLDERIAADNAALESARDTTPQTVVSAPEAILEARPHPEYDAPDTETAETVETAPEAPQEAVKEPEKAVEETNADRFKRERLARKAAERKAAEYQAQIAAIQAGQPGALDEATVMARAEQIATAKAFDAQCDKIATDGAKAFPDFQEALRDLWDAMNCPPNQLHVPLIEAAIEAGEPHKILHYLGTNPDEAERLATMPLHRQAVAIAKLAAKLTPAEPVKPVSKAPAPLNTVTATSTAPVERDMMKMGFADYEKKHRQDRHEKVWGRPS